MNHFTIKYGIDHLDWHEVNQLFIKAPLGERPPEKFQTTCKNTNVVVSIYDKNKLIGFGRMLTDFMAYSNIYDLVVLPEYQRQGIGKLIIQSLLEKAPECWVTILFAEPGKEIFYEKFEFAKMKTAMAKFKNRDAAKTKGFI